MDSIVLIVLVIAIAIIGIIYVLSTSGSLTNQGGTTSPVAICPAGSSNRVIDTKIYQSLVAIGKQDIYRPMLDARWVCYSLDNPTHVTDAVGCSVGEIITNPHGDKMCMICPPGMKISNGKCQP